MKQGIFKKLDQKFHELAKPFAGILTSGIPVLLMLIPSISIVWYLLGCFFDQKFPNLIKLAGLIVLAVFLFYVGMEMPGSEAK